MKKTRQFVLTVRYLLKEDRLRGGKTVVHRKTSKMMAPDFMAATRIAEDRIRNLLPSHAVSEDFRIRQVRARG